MVQALKQVSGTGNLVVLLCLLLTSCNKDRYEEKYVTIPLSEEYKNWFKETGVNNIAVYTKARSSSGLEETIGVSKLPDTEPTKGPYRPCYYEYGQTITVGYGSTLYNNLISITLFQQQDGKEPFLRLMSQEQSAEKRDRYTMQFQLGSSEQHPITLNRYHYASATTENIQLNAFPEVVTVDSVLVNSKLYNQVFPDY